MALLKRWRGEKTKEKKKRLTDGRFNMWKKKNERINQQRTSNKFNSNRLCLMFDLQSFTPTCSDMSRLSEDRQSQNGLSQLPFQVKSNSKFLWSNKALRHTHICIYGVWELHLYVNKLLSSYSSSSFSFI